MGFRFRKSLKILPGIRLNISKSGVSTSLGGPGATVNISRKGTRRTVGIPGSGLSYSTFSNHRSGGEPTVPGSNPQTGGQGCGCLVLVGLIVAGLAMCSHKSDQPPMGQSSTSAAQASLAASIETPKAYGSGETVYVQPKNLNARARPSASAKVVGRLREGQALRVVETQGDWIKVAQGSALVWIASSHVSGTRSVGSRAAQTLIARPASYARPQRAPRTRFDYGGDTCPCSGSHICIGPRGGRYCITSGGNKRYGV